MEKILFFKGGEGSGWPGPPKGTHVSSSKEINTIESARAYWMENFGGKCLLRHRAEKRKPQ